ncbi:aquaporin-11 isoform X3 [Pleurodeles waltl]|uniref:aquaporin-11 isoform X3 n=1 Tax=Pleurodeles waltl TaxID=8319 RepID=UPI003709C2BF
MADAEGGGTFTISVVVIEDVSLSLMVMMVTVMLCYYIRINLRNVIPLRQQYLAMEFIFTFQLCFLLHEFWVLFEVGKIDKPIILPFLYATIVVHVLTSTCAECSPSTTFHHMMTGRSSLTKATEKLFFQFIAAALAWLAATKLHKLGLTRVHGAVEPECTPHLHSSVAEGVAVEMGCAFVFHCVLHLLTHTWYRVHVIGLTHVALMQAAGHLTGAMFNPAVALSLNFFCKGTNISDNMFVYWLGPIAGMILAVALFDHIFPTLKRLTGGETGTLKID